ncbi:uncharacterized protein LOC143446405 [Clavelina lepadiformis]|uniref:uncharacterized protein LOC143446405 n=1 Tax=Clavelina lepadiformis TaxID=159417 RepID=UPI00404101E9
MVNQLVELVIFKDLFPKHYKSIRRCGEKQSTTTRTMGGCYRLRHGQQPWCYVTNSSLSIIEQQPIAGYYWKTAGCSFRLGPRLLIWPQKRDSSLWDGVSL